MFDSKKNKDLELKSKVVSMFDYKMKHSKKYNTSSLFNGSFDTATQRNLDNIRRMQVERLKANSSILKNYKIKE